MEQTLTRATDPTAASRGTMLPLVGAIVLMLLWGAYTLSICWEIFTL
jgi:hypothetical protein